MDTIKKICEQLVEKRELFLAYEELTKSLLNCEPDSAEHYIIERSRLANEIDVLNEEIGRTCDANESGDLLYKAAMVQLEYQYIPEEMREVFRKGQEVRSVIGRIQELDKLVVDRLANFREEARSKIQENQNLPKIKKYLTDLSNQPDGTGLKNDKA